MIYSFDHLDRDLELSVDLCVVGSGAGGAPVAWLASQAGKRVAVMEAGSYWWSEDFTQLEHEMFPRLYQDKAGRGTRDRAIQVHQGKAVGGSTIHNLNLCARLPGEIHTRWRRRYGLTALPPERLGRLYGEVEQHLSVSRLGEADLAGSSLVLKRGCEVLGYRGGFLRHNRVGCAASGFCELGCPFDAKQNALKVYMAPAVEAGAVVMADCWAVRLAIAGRRVQGVVGVTRHPETGAKGSVVRVNARAVCVSASATGTPVLLRRSQVPDPFRLIGSRLHLHPGAAVAGIFPETLRSWMGVPQSYECTEFLDFSQEDRRRVWIIPAFAHPAGASSLIPGFGQAHQRYMGHYPQMAALSPMVHDLSSGAVRPKGEFGVDIDYWPDTADREQLALGIRECARLLLAAGADTVIVPRARAIEIRRPEEVTQHLGKLEIERHDIPLTSVHPMSTVWMGDDDRIACVTSRGRYHHLDNLFVSDTSLFPTSIGIPPQLTTYAVGHHVGREILGFLG